MLITKRSRRPSDRFRSRFEDGEASFPIRHYLRCREEVISGIIQMVLLVLFLITLGFFARTLDHFFLTHASSIRSFYRWLSLALIIGMMLLVLRRLLGRWRETREARDEMRELVAQVPELKRLRR